MPCCLSPAIQTIIAPVFHPAACLTAWLGFAVAAQFFGWHSLALTATLLLFTGHGVRSRWWRLLLRAKWLLLTLWLVLAYGTPGDLWLGQTWAPSIDGVDAASLHAARLLILLGSLSWLFQTLSHASFIAALWVLARPFARTTRVDRSVARLSLVFDYLEHAPPKGSWRHFLELPSDEERMLETLQLAVPRWRGQDSLFLLIVLAVIVLLTVMS